MTRSPARRLSRAERARQILDTAERMFSTRGYEATTMESIAREAGVTRAVVYTHYANREEILLAGVRRARTQLDEDIVTLIRGIAADVSIAEVIERGGRIYLGLLDQDRDRWQLLFASPLSFSAELRRDLDQLRRQTISRIAELGAHLRPDLPPSRVEAYAYAISGVGEQLGRWWLTHPSTSLDEVVKIYVDFIVQGIDTAKGVRR